MPKPRVLVVDDDAEMQATLPIFLKRIIDCDVVVKSDGSDAITALDNETFDMLIQDLQMPGVDGFTVLAHAARRRPEAIRIVLTGVVDPAITKRVEDMGAIYVAKPPEPAALRLVINRELKKRSGS